MCLPQPTLRTHLEAMKAAIPHGQHLGRERAQHLQTPDAFRNRVRIELGITDGVRAAFAYVDRFDLRESAVAPRAGRASEVSRIDSCIRHVFGGAINRHQAQPTQKSVFGLSASQRLADLMEESR